MAASVNLCDVTTVGVVRSEEGEDSWSTAVEPAAVASRQEKAVECRVEEGGAGSVALHSSVTVLRVLWTVKRHTNYRTESGFLRSA